MVTTNKSSDDLQDDANKLLEEFEKEMAEASEEMIAALKEEENKN